MSAYQKRIPSGTHPVIGQLIQAHIARGLSQGTLAERLDVSQMTMSRWESGLRAVTFADAVRWAAVLGLELSAAPPALLDGQLPELVAGGLA